ncbi:hypothetical protein RM844_21855 [Streptomyces sp. DSM 44915]|uniref:Integral membrane protein n=1 Tax=Streptomyces chisholmiae TaxID=3075540 RepID=A0ABU2JVF2_9ACTN|nr:hypothetical protein [Streptomyces sp. DSM 44915]MDT0268937.1 hypothetical protein [Streptomyces sp. DSM 44915]
MLTGLACTLLSAAGLGVSLLVAKRRRYATAMRLAALSLVPVGLAMTGILRLIINMTFNPVAWAGVGVLGFALVLFVSARLADRGRGGGGGDAQPAPGTPAVSARGASTPALPASGGKGGKAAAGGADDFSDIEAILKKHGI